MDSHVVAHVCMQGCREARGVPTQRWPAQGRRLPCLTAADGSSGCMEAQRVKFLQKKCSTEVA